MGGRGSSSRTKSRLSEAGKGVVPKTKKSRSTKAVEIRDFIQKQVGVNIEKYATGVTRKFGGGVIVDWKHMPRVDKQKIKRLSVMPSYKTIKLETWSGWEMLIMK